MTYEQIMSLLDKGMTPDQVMEIMRAPAPEPQQETAPEQESTQPEQPPEPAQQPEPVQQPDQSGAILAALDKLTKTVQAAAILGSRQPETPPPQTSSDIILGSIKQRQGIKD